MFPEVVSWGSLRGRDGSRVVVWGVEGEGEGEELGGYITGSHKIRGISVFPLAQGRLLFA